VKKLNQLWLQHGTARNLQFFYIVLALVALARRWRAERAGGS
jgi:hypothetical protein